MTELCPNCKKEEIEKPGKHTGPEAKEAMEKGWCWTCGYWSLAIRKNNMTIIDGFTYKPGTRTEGKFRGMAGRRFDIEYFDGQRCTTFDLWGGGQIPENFRHLRPDNAKFRGAEKRQVGETTCWNPSSDKEIQWPNPKNLDWESINKIGVSDE